LIDYATTSSLKANEGQATNQRIARINIDSTNNKLADTIYLAADFETLFNNEQ
jgi:hypothetical protein